MKSLKFILKETAERLKSEKLIDDDVYKELIKLAEDFRIRIAILGQKNSGKSTLLNALIFEDLVLPMNDISETAALIFIKHGPEPKAKIEFLTEKEFEVLLKVSLPKEEVEEFKKDFFKKGSNYFGKKKEIQITELEKYVSAQSEISNFVKNVWIEYPSPHLKEREYIDTPGFNDPIETRERKVFEFLREANIVIFITYAGRVFDSTDLEILLNYLPVFRTGKLIILVNKKDILYQTVESDSEDKEKRVLNYIRNKREEFVNKSRFYEAHRRLLLSAPLIPFSALSALMYILGKEKVNADEELKFYLEKFLEEIPDVNGFDDLYKFSGMKELNEVLSNLESEIIEVAKTSFANTATEWISEKERNIKTEISKLRQDLNFLEKEEEDLKKELEILNDFSKNVEWGIGIGDLRKRIDEKISELEREIDKIFQEIKKYIGRKLPEKRRFEKEYRLKFTEYDYEIREKFREYLKDIKDIIYDWLNRLGETLSDSIIVKRYTDFGMNLIENFKIELLNEIKLDIEFEKKLQDIHFKFKRFMFFIIESEENAKERLLSEIKKVETAVRKEICSIKNHVDGIINKFLDAIESKIIDRIRQMLDKIELKLKSKVQEKSKNLLIMSELNKELENLKQIRMNIERILKEEGILKDA